jgi:hypothetical protein
MRFVLDLFDYPEKSADVVGTPDPLIVGRDRDMLERDEDIAPLTGLPGAPPCVGRPVIRVSRRTCRSAARARSA